MSIIYKAFKSLWRDLFDRYAAARRNALRIGSSFPSRGRVPK